MKKTFTLSMLLLLSVYIFSQDTITVSMSSGYANEVFYSLEDSVLKSSPRENWDIAFATDQMSVTVLANNGLGINVYTYTNGDTADWKSTDTTGMSWDPLYNSIATWETGAFNQHTKLAYPSLDYGWGNYSTTTHNISGDSIYIMSMSDGSYKKLVITEKNAIDNQWTFMYADLDNSNADTLIFDADTVSSDYVYFSITNQTFVDQEPDSDWQMLFTKYYDYTYNDGMGYNVTGILTNSDVWVQEVTGIPSESAVFDSTLLTDTISTIGFDWKSFNMSTFTYEVTDSLTYFLQDSSTTGYPVYKIVITGFDRTTGTFTFTQEQTRGTAPIEEEEEDEEEIFGSQVSMGSSYANEVFYSFEDSVLRSSPRENWDIAFAADQMSVTVLANNGLGINVYTYSNGDTADWSSVDTSGMVWNPLYNSIATWETGAFNENTNLNYTTYVFDYGWGNYDMSTHNISGDSIYIMSMSDGSYKKLVISEKNAVDNEWTFVYADLDGSNEETVTFGADTASSDFIYYSMTNNSFAGQGADSRWQLLFTKYYDYTYSDGMGYNVTGILTNSDVWVQEVSNVDTAANDYNLKLFTDTISTIGFDWKSFDHTTFTYKVSDSLVYFVQDVQDTIDGEFPIYKFIITGFDRTTGTFTFTQELVGTDSSASAVQNSEEEENSNENETAITQNAIQALTVYPNPASDVLNIGSTFTNSNVQLSIYNMTGKLVLSSTSIENSLDISSLSMGIYNILIYNEGTIYSTKFIKQ